MEDMDQFIEELENDLASEQSFNSYVINTETNSIFDNIESVESYSIKNNMCNNSSDIYIYLFLFLGLNNNFIINKLSNYNYINKINLILRAGIFFVGMYLYKKYQYKNE